MTGKSPSMKDTLELQENYLLDWWSLKIHIANAEYLFIIICYH